MSLSKIERGYFLRLFSRGGYVLDFSTADFDTFTMESVGVALVAHYCLSKGKSLNAFVEEAPARDADKLLLDLFEYYEAYLVDELEEGSSLYDRDQYKKILRPLSAYCCKRAHRPGPLYSEEEFGTALYQRIHAFADRYAVRVKGDQPD